MQLHSFNTTADLEAALAAEILAELRAALAARQSASILFSGGGTPKKLMEKLATTADFDWSAVNVGLVDDRMVPENSEYSNAALLETHFFSKISGTRPSFHPLVRMPELMEENMQFALQSTKALGTIDVAVLGMGGDGHFASLFPKDEASMDGLRDDYPKDLLYTRAPSYPEQRISYSWPYLQRAANLYLHITGTTKKSIIDASRSQALPIDSVLHHSQKEIDIYWAE